MSLRFSMLGGWVMLAFLGVAVAQTPSNGNKTGKEVTPPAVTARKTYPPELVEKGSAMFRQDCSFCHGRDAGGGESGPDLT